MMPQERARTVAVVPARGGSKGIPRKNLVEIGGRPLIAWSLLAARGSRVVDEVVVSSDDDEILDVASAYGASVHKRAKKLGADAVPAVEAAVDVMRSRGTPNDRVVMLLPTSPLRLSEDIDGAVDLFETARPPAVVSVTQFDKNLIHLREMSPEGALVPLVRWSETTAQRQGQPPLYLLNGSVYVSRASDLVKRGTFHVEDALGYVMPTERSIDVDTFEDLEQVRTSMRARGGR